MATQVQKGKKSCLATMTKKGGSQTECFLVSQQQKYRQGTATGGKSWARQGGHTRVKCTPGHPSVAVSRKWFY